MKSFKLHCGYMVVPGVRPENLSKFFLVALNTVNSRGFSYAHSFLFDEDLKSIDFNDFKLKGFDSLEVNGILYQILEKEEINTTEIPKRFRIYVEPI